MCLAIPGRLVGVTDADRRLATVEIAGVERTVDISLLDANAPGDRGVEPNDWVLIHVGFAIARLNEAEAAATLRLLQGMGNDLQRELELFDEGFDGIR